MFMESRYNLFLNFQTNKFTIEIKVFFFFKQHLSNYFLLSLLSFEKDQPQPKKPVAVKLPYITTTHFIDPSKYTKPKHKYQLMMIHNTSRYHVKQKIIMRPNLDDKLTTILFRKNCHLAIKNKTCRLL